MTKNMELLPLYELRDDLLMEIMKLEDSISRGTVENVHDALFDLGQLNFEYNIIQRRLWSQTDKPVKTPFWKRIFRK